MGPVRTFTARDENEALNFIDANVSKANLYYSVNPTRTALKSKAKKVDIAAVEYLLADLDPRADETPEAAKRRFLKEVQPSSPADGYCGQRQRHSVAVAADCSNCAGGARQQRKIVPETAALIG